MHIHFHYSARSGAPAEAIGHEEVRAAALHGHHATFGATDDEFLRHAPTVEVLVAHPREIAALNLAAAPRLKLLQTTAAGVDPLVPFHMIPDGVQLANNRGTHAAKAGEYAAMAILMLVNRLPYFITAQRDGAWRRETCGLAAARRLTVVGLGSLGSAAALWAKRLGMNVTGIRHSVAPHPDCDVTLTMAGLDTVLPETDILLLACPLTAATRGLLSKARLALLPPDAGVINIGRSALLDQAALFTALDEERLGGAVLDVFAQEPIPPGDPAWRVKNLIITPHMSSDDMTVYNARTLEILKENIRALAAGETLATPVDFAKGY